jgi:hypothetical protein
VPSLLGIGVRTIEEVSDAAVRCDTNSGWTRPMPGSGEGHVRCNGGLGGAPSRASMLALDMNGATLSFR